MVYEVNDFEKSLSLLDTFEPQCAALMKMPHFNKMGKEGIFAIIAKAKSLNIDPLDALNGGLYFVQGKVEMSSSMMNQLIRQCGHSVSKDPASTDTKCILHGKRKDTGDIWTESFSIDEAKRAGIYKGVWEKYPRDMLFARALSRLARQLFPDVIKGCYVEGEISGAKEVEREEARGEVNYTPQEKAQKNIEEATVDVFPVSVEFITEEEKNRMLAIIGDNAVFLHEVLRRTKLSKLEDLERSRFAGCITWLENQKKNFEDVEIVDA